MSDANDSGTVRAVSRALAVIDAFAARGATHLTIADLVRVSGLPRTTVLRLADTLVAERVLQHQDGALTIGPRLALWGMFAEQAWAVPEATRERMADLALETGETVSVYVRSGTRRVAVAQAPGPSALRHVVQVGDRLPLSRGASSMVLLAGAAEPLDDLLATLRADPDLPGFDTAALRMRVAEARERGWAATHGEREPGISGVAVPLLSDPQPVALALGGPTARFTDERVPAFVRALQAAAADIRRTGLPPAATSG
ncbi:IclR family transcriptional regulator [Microbacterium marinilacus]|uniref:IclR family transcriptional regulator n=1 Tax=Microbacterium marinilacus TaxID=415209 RepID=A0ABP7BTP4_9MICO|nr:IclR family transcriptional regulator [Microbacterium marinilacus]MBY0689142.1 IclR family transcriptional regulator [Microbacterium marinilacus]